MASTVGQAGERGRAGAMKQRKNSLSRTTPLPGHLRPAWNVTLGVTRQEQSSGYMVTVFMKVDMVGSLEHSRRKWRGAGEGR